MRTSARARPAIVARGRCLLLLARPPVRGNRRRGWLSLIEEAIISGTMARFGFADVELDLARFEVTRAGRRLSLEPKAVDVLRFFVERPGSPRHPRRAARRRLAGRRRHAQRSDARRRAAAARARRRRLRGARHRDGADAWLSVQLRRSRSIAPPVPAVFAAASPAPVNASDTPLACDTPLASSAPRRPLVGWALAAAGAVLAVVSRQLAPRARGRRGDGRRRARAGDG